LSRGPPRVAGCLCVEVEFRQNTHISKLFAGARIMALLHVGVGTRTRCMASLAAVIAVAFSGCNQSTPPQTPTGGAERSATRAHEVAAPAPEEPATEDPVSAPEPAETAAQPVVESKNRRTPIYDETADARAEIDAALSRAQYDHKRVLVKFGGNWCGWCFK